MYRPEKGHQGQFPLPKHTLDLRFLHGTQAEEMHRLFLGSSLPASLLPLRPFLAGASEVPSQLLRFLRHLCVADGQAAQQRLGFSPSYTTREAVLAFGAALRLREARLLTEAYV